MFAECLLRTEWKEVLHTVFPLASSPSQNEKVLNMETEIHVILETYLETHKCHVLFYLYCSSLRCQNFWKHLMKMWTAELRGNVPLSEDVSYLSALSDTL